MLQRLHISNYALIDFLDISFAKGLSSITGETGAGKSIILGALSLLLGKRCDTSVLKNKDIKSIVEIEIVLNSNEFADLFAKHDVDFHTQTIIRREISPQGKSRAFINDTPVSLQALKEIGEACIDIHSQHQNLFLRESSFQCEVVDAAANIAELQCAYYKEFVQLSAIQKELNDFKKAIAKHANDLEYYSYRLRELQQAQLHAGELAELEQEAAMLEHGEDIKQLLEQAEYVFAQDDSVLAKLKQLLSGFEKRASLSAEFQNFSQRLQQTYIELADIATEIAQYNSRLDFDPARLDAIHNRLDLIHGLLHKFGVESEQQLLDEQLRLETLVAHIENAEIDGADFEKQYSIQKEKVLDIARAIREKRKMAIAKLEPQIISMLQKLGMPWVTFAIELHELSELQHNGADEVQMLFSANKNIALQWLGEVSSGGELSRLMLCLKTILAKTKSLKTIIFDEIDTGVSGEIADQMGRMMQDMAKDLQVIVITHLPQIAAKAEFQYKVFKSETSDTTSSNIIALTQEQRIEELAKMMSGKEVTQAAVLNAKHLLGI